MKTPRSDFTLEFKKEAVRLADSWRSRRALGEVSAILRGKVPLG